MSNIFDELPEDQPEADIMDALKTRFGDGQTIDLEKLSRAKIESDRHITTLERELAELRQKDSKSQTIEEILTQIRQSSQPPATPQASQPSGSPKPEESVNVEELVRQTIAAREQETALERNRRTVTEGLEKVYGADAQRELNKVARSLGVPLKDLQEQADKSPAMFFRIIGVDPSKTSAPPSGAVAPRPSPTTPNQGSGTVRDKAYYDRLKASNPTEYRSQKVQQQMYKDWLARPDLFQG